MFNFNGLYYYFNSILACNFISFEIKEIDSKNVTDFINGFLQTISI